MVLQLASALGVPLRDYELRIESWFPLDEATAQACAALAAEDGP